MLKSKKLSTSDTTDKSLSDKKYEEMLKENQFLKEKIDQLLSMQSQKETTKIIELLQDEEPLDEFNEIKINQDDYIKVVSLCDNPLYMSSLGFGKGKQWTWEKFGDTKRIVYSDVVAIMENYQRFLKKGYFYIADKRVIRRHGLDDLYESILSKEKIQKILNCNDDTSVELFSNASEEQRPMILRMIVSKIARGENMDLNIVDKISRIAKVNIVEQAKEMKEISELR
jgi:hypothetical protein